MLAAPPQQLNRKRSRSCLQEASVATACAASTTGTRDNGDDGNGNSSNNDNTLVLRGAVVCLSGFSPTEKERLHELIEALGGEYTRAFNSTQNTHLVCTSATGPKYEAALLSHPEKIQIVRPSWLDACARADRQTRVAEREHYWEPHQEGEEKRNEAGNKEGANENATAQLPSVSLQDTIAEQLSCPENCRIKNCTLFSSCKLHLVGFEDGSETHIQLGRLIRRGLGTIFWEFNVDSVSHVIVNDGCDISVSEAIKTFRLKHPNSNAVFCSPRWVTCSWEKGRLLDPSKFAPQYQKPNAKKNKQLSSQQQQAKVILKNPRVSSLFRGSVFVLMRVAPPKAIHSYVDFCSKELEHSIRAHGGQLISSKLVEALKVDNSNKSAGVERRKCYVIGWGCFTKSHLLIHPLLAQVKRQDLCDVVEVTPVWFKTCLSEQKCVSAEQLPVLFKPKSWPIRSLIGARGGKQREAKNSESGGGKATTATLPRQLRVSVTGLTGSRRAATVHLLEAMGAFFDDSMRTSTTHLVCSTRKGSGLKFEKAIQWKLHVVTVEWLYHVAQYGYSGENNNGSEGCECRFSVVPSSVAK